MYCNIHPFAATAIWLGGAVNTAAGYINANRIKSPFNEREALTYYEAAGFSGPAEWCRFRRARMVETMSDTELERRSTESRVETFLNFCAAAKEEEGGENRDEL